MLLYPTINREIDQEYRLRDNTMYIKTLNLDQEFYKIEERLQELIL